MSEVKKIRCGARKHDSCLKEPDLCEWDGTKCNKRSEKIPSVAKPKTVRCGGRKEKTCKLIPGVCSWVNDKCIDNSKLRKDDLNTEAKADAKVEDNAKTKVIKKKLVKKLVKKLSPKTVVKSPSPKVVVKSPSPKIVVKSPSPKTVVKSPSPKVVVKSPISQYVSRIQSLDNRHCMYVSENGKHLPFSPVVNTHTCYKEKYDSAYRSISNVHIGQRKLLLSEIQFLTEYYEKNPNKHPVLLYVGAAPGTHLLLLSLFFPHVFFILYDGAKFDPELKKYPHIFKVYEGEEGFMTSEKCKKLAKDIRTDGLLFVSDIRLGDENREKFEHGVTRDMMLQQEWVQILKPISSLLKFRMSYNMKEGDKQQYMKGKILYGIWPKPLSGETRLIVDKKDVNNIINYDFTSYEQTMFFHNKKTRPYCYDIDNRFKKYIMGKNNPYCTCYDCMAELLTLQRFSKLFNVSLDRVINDFAAYMNKEKRPAFQKKYVKQSTKSISTSC